MDYEVHNKRYGNEVLGLWEFVTPGTPLVIKVVDEVARGADDPIWALWDWCCQNIQYPPRSDNSHFETTSRSRFMCGFPLSRTCDKVTNSIDFWQFPFETLAIPRWGDCDDVAFALCSMLLHVMPRGTVRCALGTYQGEGHCWVVILNPADNRWYVLEPTLNDAIGRGIYDTPDADPYNSLIKFDDDTADDKKPGYEQFLR
jgi:hypothetical protein